MVKDVLITSYNYSYWRFHGFSLVYYGFLKMNMGKCWDIDGRIPSVIQTWLAGKSPINLSMEVSRNSSPISMVHFPARHVSLLEGHG